MGKPAPKKSTREAVEDASKQHQEVCQFLNRPLIKKRLPELRDRAANEVVLLHRLCDVSGPITYRDQEIDKMGTQGTVSNAVERLNKYLKELSDQFDVLRERNVIITVPRHTGGLQIGRYFICQDTRTGRYLEANEIKNILADAWLAFRKGKAAETGPEKILRSLIRKLKAEAVMALAEKLHQRGLNDYQPLAMELGSVRAKEVTGADLQDRDSRQRPEDHNRTWDDFHSEELGHPQGVYILSSDTGTGKTTWLRYLQLKIFQQEQFLPIFVDASKLEGLNFKDTNSFIPQLVELLELNLPKTQVTAFLEKHFDKVKMLVDGLDQIKGAGTEYSDLLDKLLLLGNVIVASRPFAVISQEGTASVKFLRLKHFDTGAQKRFFGKNYDRACEVCHSCHELMGIPMLAFMVRTLIENKQDKNIRTRTDIYERFTNHILTTDIGYKHDKLRSDTDVDTRVRLALAEISYEALAKGHIQKIPVSFCEPYTRKHATTIEQVLKHGLLNLIVDRTRGTDKFLYFSHQSFQEYLAAEWASQNAKLCSRILKEMWNPKWKEVINFLAGLIGEEFIQQIWSPSCEDNCIHSRLFLAAECCKELGQTLPLESILFDQLRKLSTEPPFEMDALFAIGQLNLPGAVDFLLSVARITEEKRWRMQNNIKQFDPRLNDIGFCAFKILGTITIGAKLSSDQKNRIIDLLVDSRQHKSRYAGVRLGHILEMLARAGQLDAQHANRIADLILLSEPPYYRCMSVICKLPDNLVTRCIDRAFVVLESKDQKQREAARRLISELGSKGRLSENNVDEIFDRLMSNEPGIRKSTLRLLQCIRPRWRFRAKHVDRVIAMLENSDREQVRLTAELIAQWATIPYDFPSCRFLIRHVEKVAILLDQPDAEMKKIAVDMLGHVICRRSYIYAERMFALLSDPDSCLELKCSVLNTIGRIGEKLSHSQKRGLIKQFAGMLIELLQSKNRELRRGIAAALYNYRNDLPLELVDRVIEIYVSSKEEMPSIPIPSHLSPNQVSKAFALLERKEGMFHRNAISILMGQPKNTLIPYVERIMKILQNGDVETIGCMLSLLGKFKGRLSSTNLDAIIKFLDCQHAELQRNAFSCLMAHVDNLRAGQIKHLLSLLRPTLGAPQHYAADLLLEVPDKVPRDYIAKLIVYIGHKDRFLHAIWATLKEKLTEREYENIQEAVDLKDPEVVNSLRPVVMKAFEAPHAGDAERAFQLLQAISYSSIVTEVESFAKRTIPRLAPDSMRELVKEYLKYPASETLCVAVEHLPNDIVVEYLPDFLSLFENRDERIKEISVIMVGKLVDALNQDHIAKIIPLLCDPDFSIRDKAYILTKELHSSRGLPASA